MIQTTARRLTLILLLLLLPVACRDAANESAGAAPAGAVARLGQGSLTSLAATPDGMTLLAGDRTAVARYDGDELAQTWVTATSEAVQTVALSEGGTWALAGLGNGDLLLLSGADGTLSGSLPGFDPGTAVTALAFAPDSGAEPLFVAGYANGQLLAGRVTAEGPQPLGRLVPQSNGISALAFNPDGRILASGNRSGGLTLYDAASLGLLTTLEGHEAGQTVLALAWNPVGDRLASGDRDGEIIVWDMLRLAQLVGLQRQESAITNLAYLDGESFLSAATAAGDLVTWDTSSRSLEPARRALGAPLVGATWDANGTSALLALGDGRLQRRAVLAGLADEMAAAERRDHAPAGAHISDIALAPDGSRLLVALGNELLLWDMARRAPLQRLAGHASSLTAVAWAPDGRSFASADRAGLILVRDAADGAETARLDNGPQAVSDLAFSPDGLQLAAAGSLADTITLWDPAAGARLGTLAGEGAGLWSVAWSPDGRALLGGGVDGKLFRFAAAGNGLATDIYWRHLAWVSGVAWQDAQVASASADGSVILWELDAGNSSPLGRHGGPVRGVDYSPDGARLVSGGLDRQVIVWDADPRAAESMLARFAGHTDGVTAVAWSPDGETILSGSDDGTVMIWPAAAE